MQTIDQLGNSNDSLYADQRRAAYSYVSEAFAEGQQHGAHCDLCEDCGDEKAEAEEREEREAGETGEGTDAAIAA